MTTATLSPPTLSKAASFEAQAVKAGARRNRLLSLPALIIIGIFGVLPLLIICVYSFLVAAPYGGVQWQFSTDAYLNFLFQRDIFDDTLQFTPDFLIIYLRSFLFAVVTTVICLLLGFPTAYFMATRPPAQRNWWVLLITIPFWSNLLVRTLAIMFIIRDEGLINNALLALGVIDKPITMLYTNFAIQLGLLYAFLPFMVLPLYSSLEKLDFRLIEAAYDLYATRRQVLWRVIIPLSKPGIIAGCLLVFIPALGAYVTPLILGGGVHLMIGDLIAQQFGSGRNWPLGCAQALILMAAVLVALFFYVRNTSGKVQHG
ncbi:ABC transporter permease [Mesorhizobium sp. VK23B]|uniref:ABC transporter permease n=1 Tax=Mesorhizobium dulcispinae TaxID=3072316 RepID=A0ABU4XE05_9HYPH|nr:MULTISPECIES: ABC transporter permease [unclassified Mesorhizobium]MDX8465329.1 ABC transporter permease [Mesorhizobium sp. VK23B]MDX8473027.1 ABC transporter permease [Mesorhizobium sp. VK23A]MDX8519990.1 ABC transporter permease [Mesorhizobium sp. VK23D]